ncbi:unnamed protein product (mitochondrion) [Plasmodiophora brassicae]|uniref:RGS domain-containing protein n=1 Tax=Plasmodiophora brassicae TaxID=37360 RepID=A0A3P3YHN8_PLABS|nr:unnamed protein product [Plasmodiophora brassicae]
MAPRRECLRVFMEDGSWTTLDATDTSTVQHLSNVLQRKRRLDQMRVPVFTLSYKYDGNQFERTLTRHECPIVIMDALEKHGRLGSPVIRVRQVDGDERDAYERELQPNRSPAQIIDVRDECHGYLDMLTGGHELFTRYWVVLSEGKLFWFKSRHDRKVRGHIDLDDVIVRSDKVNLVGLFGRVYPGVGPSAYVLRIMKPDKLVQFRMDSIEQLRTWSSSLRLHCEADSDPNGLLDNACLQIDTEEHDFWTAHEDIVRSISSMQNLVGNPFAFQAFLSFLEETHSQDGLLFWFAVNQFVTTSLHEDQAMNVAEAIFEKFLATGAPREIGISPSEQSDIQALLLGAGKVP